MSSNQQVSREKGCKSGLPHRLPGYEHHSSLHSPETVEFWAFTGPSPQDLCRWSPIPRGPPSSRALRRSPGDPKARWSGARPVSCRNRCRCRCRPVSFGRNGGATDAIVVLQRSFWLWVCDSLGGSGFVHPNISECIRTCLKHWLEAFLRKAFERPVLPLSDKPAGEG